MRHSLLPRLATLCLLLSLSSLGHVRAADGEPQSASDSATKDEQGESKSEDDKSADSAPTPVKIPGVIEAVSSAEVFCDAKHLDNLTVKRVVPHGKHVGQNENLVWFDRKDIDEKVQAAEEALRLSKLNLDGEVFAHEQFLKSQALDKESAQRNRKLAQQEYDNFVEVDREHTAKSAEFSLKAAHESLDNAKEELKQLEQMYKEDDLTEESEEIVLKRAQQAVESAQFRLDTTQIQSERTTSQQIPRTAAEQEEALARAELAYQQAMHDLRLTRQRRDVELEQKKKGFNKEDEKLQELKADRKQMVLTSPIEGIALHGKLTRGRLADKPSTLEAEAKAAPKQVLMTVVDPSKLQIRVDLDEEHLGLVSEGSTCKVLVKAFPELQASGKVKSVSEVPYAANKYDCVVVFRGGSELEQLLPTMNCELEFTPPQPADTEAEATKDQE